MLLSVGALTGLFDVVVLVTFSLYASPKDGCEETNWKMSFFKSVSIMGEEKRERVEDVESTNRPSPTEKRLVASGTSRRALESMEVSCRKEIFPWNVFLIS
jgi:hypothetical protein